MTPESSNRKSDILRKVRALYAKADSTEHVGEADAFRAKADQMMTLYAIESFELGISEPTQREKPEIRKYDYDEGAEDIKKIIPRVFYSLADLCRCKMGYYGCGSSRVVGYPADLDYLDLLVTNVISQVVGKMEPRPDRTKGYEHSLYLLKSAGLKWQKVYEMLLPVFPENFTGAKSDIALSDIPSYMISQFIIVSQEPYPVKIPRKIGVRFTGEYAKHCKKFDLSRVMANPTVYRRSFLESFQYELVMRIDRMKREQKKTTAGHGLVLASRDGGINDVLYGEWPDLKPHPENCECNTCHFKNCEDDTCSRPQCVRYRANRNKPIKYRKEVERAFDSSAASAGRSAARNIDLSGGRNNIDSTKELSD